MVGEVVASVATSGERVDRCELQSNQRALQGWPCGEYLAGKGRQGMLITA